MVIQTFYQDNYLYKMNKLRLKLMSSLLAIIISEFVKMKCHCNFSSEGHPVLYQNNLLIFQCVDGYRMRKGKKLVKKGRQ